MKKGTLLTAIPFLRKDEFLQILSTQIIELQDSREYMEVKTINKFSLKYFLGGHMCLQSIEAVNLSFE